MTTGRMLLAGLLTAYVLAVIPLEERDLIRAYGDEYRSYQRMTPRLLPRLR